MFPKNLEDFLASIVSNIVLPYISYLQYFILRKAFCQRICELILKQVARKIQIYNADVI